MYLLIIITLMVKQSLQYVNDCTHKGKRKVKLIKSCYVNRFPIRIMTISNLTQPI